ncbi:ribokinase [Tetragenococcus koreensis]|uniref:ribokinase n=1 Tax=Tetragenococcus koreensis TaxID=290335 RepID=UPI001F44A183|nr:ribokinase [Tetragenococcus koreensis]MDN6640960.1 ribokinase [Tetragenococcus sp.]MCF1615237.1 ribokinase [Tetragenococcus koreensis]MCF1625007.1 ribokinase [Tetragenococcus koreensis]MCF1627724.1 ribokinase [Tetragenococcus koreensis]MCF1678159.1 ribokinase [Tetragenococcus koreensis]
MNKVTIVGSINLDTNLRVQRMVKPGETIHGKEHYTAAGGKGANQAVAAARAECDTRFIGAVGNDSAGDQMLDLLKEENIDTTGIEIINHEATGQAFITVDDNGENAITFFAGANYAFGSEEVAKDSALIERSDFVIAQLETPIEATITAFEIARQANVKTILNPAPGESDLPIELLQATDIIVPNETEAEIITGIPVKDEASAKEAATKLHELGVEVVIITLGAKGAFYDYNGHSELVPSFKEKAVDTTAAGDTFIGTMSSLLKKDFSNLKDAILYSNKASSLTIQRFGAQPSIPYKNEIM